MIKLFYFFILNHFSIVSMNLENTEDILEEDAACDSVKQKNTNSILKSDQKKSNKNNKKKHVTFNLKEEDQSSNLAFCVDISMLDEIETSDGIDVDDFSNEKDFLIDLSTDSNVNNEIYFEENIEHPLNSQSNENEIKSDTH